MCSLPFSIHTVTSPSLSTLSTYIGLFSWLQSSQCSITYSPITPCVINLISTFVSFSLNGTISCSSSMRNNIPSCSSNLIIVFSFILWFLFSRHILTGASHYHGVNYVLLLLDYPSKLSVFGI